MLDYGLDLVELCRVDIARHSHDESIARSVQPRLVREQGHRVFRGRIICAGLRIFVLVDGEELLRHRRVFGVDPLALVLVRVVDFKAFCKAESIVEGGSQIAHLPVVAQSVDMASPHLQKALIHALLTDIQRRTQRTDKGVEPTAAQERGQHQSYPFVKIDVENHSAF